MTNESTIQKRIEHLGEDARFEVWMSLYSSEDSLRKKELKDVLTSEDPLLKTLLIRFLGNVPEERAIQFLCQLLEDSNSVIHEASKRAFEKNAFSKKWGLLIKLIYSSHEPAQFYAIEKMSQAGVLDALPLLLAMLSTENEKLLVQLLKALRYYADERVLPLILPFSDDKREGIRFRVILILGVLYAGEVREARKPLLYALKDSSPQVRRAVLWSLRSHPVKKDLKHIFPIAKSDPEPTVRQEALILFNFFPSKKAVLFLLNVLVNEKAKIVLLKAEAVLYSLPLSLTSNVLWKLIRRKKGKVKDKALLILAELRGAVPVFVRYLLRQIKKEKDPKKILPLLQALGTTKDPSCIAIMEPHLKGNPLFGYTAMTALLKLWTRHPTLVPIATYLEDPEITPLFKQTVLKQMLKSKKWDLYAEEMQDCLISLLDHENLNIRYLAAQVLAPISSELILDLSFQAALKESDPAYAQFLKDTLQKQLCEKPHWMGYLVQKNWDNEEGLRFLFAIMQEARLFGRDLLQLVSSLLDPPVSFHQSKYRDLLKNFFSSFLFQKKLPLDLFFKQSANLADLHVLLNILSDIIKKYPDIDAPLPVDLLIQWFDSDDAQLSSIIIDLLSMSRDDHAIGFLVGLVCRQEMKSYQIQASDGLQRLMRGKMVEQQP
jgi:HEAT repeat protein